MSEPRKKVAGAVHTAEEPDQGPHEQGTHGSTDAGSEEMPLVYGDAVSLFGRYQDHHREEGQSVHRGENIIQNAQKQNNEGAGYGILGEPDKHQRADNAQGDTGKEVLSAAVAIAVGVTVRIVSHQRVIDCVPDDNDTADDAHQAGADAKDIGAEEQHKGAFKGCPQVIGNADRGIAKFFLEAKGGFFEILSHIILPPVLPD